MIIVAQTISLRVVRSRALAIVNINILVLASLIYIVIGLNIEMPYGLSTRFISDNCILAKFNKTEEISSAIASSNQTEVKDVVDLVANTDKKIFKGLNSYMCTMSCPCDSGDENSTLSKAYKNLTEETYNKFGRTKSGNSAFKDFQWGSMVESHTTVL